MPQPAVGYALGAWAVAVAWSDLRHRRVPNVLLVLMLVPATLAVIVNGQGLLDKGVLASLIGMLVAGLPLLPGYASGQMGAGDIKFSACIGGLLGPTGAFEMLLMSALMIGLVSLVLLKFRGSASRSMRLPVAPMFSAAFAVQLFYGRILPLPEFLS